MLIADVQVDKGHPFVIELRTRVKTPVKFVRTNITQELQVRDMVKTAVSHWGCLDYTANCAGICEKIFDEEETVSTALVDR